jgi:hypothetical protein
MEMSDQTHASAAWSLGKESRYSFDTSMGVPQGEEQNALPPPGTDY